MAVSPGTRLGPYEIVSALGAGGMGEVYRARDTKLHRDVALKILPEVFTTDRDRLVRFTREAQVLAALNHSNIATIYGLEDSPSTASGQAPSTGSGQAPAPHALVMELVEGDDLSTVIRRGPIPLADALPIARQIADALEAAHEHGIVHRDLKPANIKVRADGTVKVLDFGLAKLMGPDGSGATADIANSPTLTGPATQFGMILGTAAYMSPEQAKGRSVDKRADIWAFGAVLYEMLAGRRAFRGDDVSEILAAVLKEDVDLAALPAGTPPAIRGLIQRCLERDVRRRLRDIGDARHVLEGGDDRLSTEISATRSGESPVASVPSKSSASSRAIAAVIVVAALVSGVVVGHTLWKPALQTDSAVVRLSIPAPGAVTRVTVTALAPDASFVAFIARSVGSSGLYIRRLDDLTTRLVDNTEGADRPFVSPDSKWIGFDRGRRFWKVAASGGEPIAIGEAPADYPGGAWGPGGSIVFSTNWYTGLVSMPAGGGAVHQISTVDTGHGEKGHWLPQ